MTSATRLSARAPEPEMTSISPPPNSIAAMDPRRFIISPCNPPAVRRAAFIPRNTPNLGPERPEENTK
jgi:hypothetical protein